MTEKTAGASAQQAIAPNHTSSHYILQCQVPKEKNKRKLEIKNFKHYLKNILGEAVKITFNKCQPLSTHPSDEPALPQQTEAQSIPRKSAGVLLGATR